MVSTHLRFRSYQLDPGGRVLVVVAQEPTDTNLFGQTKTTIVPLSAGADFDEIHDNANILQALSDHGRVCLAFSRADDAEKFTIYLSDDGAEERFDPDESAKYDEFGD